MEGQNSVVLTLEKYRRMSMTAKEKVTKKQMSALLETLTIHDASPQRPVNSTLETKLDVIIDQLKEVKDELSLLRVENEKVKQRMEKIEGENIELRKTLIQQQCFMESVDAERRAANLIITGLPETDIEIGGIGEDGGNQQVYRSELEKVQLIMKVVNSDAEILSFRRLGKPRVPPTLGRPLLLQLKRAEQRRNILVNSKNLKAADGILKRVFVKKDTHPSIQKEINRLEYVKRTETRKDCNQGKHVIFDRASRTVQVDGQVVDKFNAHFLH